MVLGFPKEHDPQETRAAVTPQTVEKLVALGAEVLVEQGVGSGSRHTDADYEKAGARLTADRAGLLAGSQVILRVAPPPMEEVGMLARGTVHISHLNPFGDKDLVLGLAKQGASTVSMEMIPRTTRAQKMDSLSSQASLAGYVAVVLAAERLNQAFPMMVTPAGTLSPARVFIIGAGVAGLQAIATARRLGAIVEAFDTRSVVEEQVRSLGARFVKVELGETGQTADGYAKELGSEQLERQRQVMARHCAQADVVITTAQVFGRPAPRIVTDGMIAGMKPDCVIVDMAVDSGGNVEGSVSGKEELVHGVRVLGYPNLARRVPRHASQMYANNVYGLLEEFWDKDSGTLSLDRADEIVAGCLITAGGEVVNQRIKEVYGS